MLTILPVETNQHRQQVQNLIRECVLSMDTQIIRELGVSAGDVAAFVEHAITQLDQFTPPNGRLLLAQEDFEAVGCAGLRTIAPDIGEIKRMYVRPQHRRQGIGRSLMETLLQEAQQMGYSHLRLDCACFLTEAQALYRSFGFTEIAPYPESEIAEQYRNHWRFMEKRLR